MTRRKSVDSVSALGPSISLVTYVCSQSRAEISGVAGAFLSVEIPTNSGPKKKKKVEPKEAAGGSVFP